MPLEFQEICIKLLLCKITQKCHAYLLLYSMFMLILTLQHFIKISYFHNIITEMTYLALIECVIDTTAEFNPTSHDILVNDYFV